MALRERNVCTEEGLVPRAEAIQSSLRPSSTHRRMSAVNFLSDTLLFIPTRATTSLFGGSRLRHWLHSSQEVPNCGTCFFASTLPLQQEAYAEARLPHNAIAWLKAHSDTKIVRWDDAR